MAAIQESYLAELPQPEWVDDAQTDFGLSIKSWERLSIRPCSEGLQRTHLVTLDDESKYVLRSTQPYDQQWETSCDFRPPLATRVKGFNTHMALKLAEAGIYSRIVGTNQAHGFDMEHEALATMLILNEDDARQAERPRPECDPFRSIGTGYSMGAMDLLQELTVASGAGREFIASIGIDPCLANPHSLSQELTKPADSSRYLYNEGRSLIGIGASEFAQDHSVLKHKTLLYLGHLAGTISVSPQFLANTYDKWLMLATGDAGQNLAQIPTESVLVLHFFNGSKMNDADDYIDRLTEGHPYFRPIKEAGVHLSGADRNVMEGTVHKIATALRLDQVNASKFEMANELAYPLLTDAA